MYKNTGDIIFARMNNNWMSTNTAQTLSGTKTFSSMPKISAAYPNYYDNSTNIATTRFVKEAVAMVGVSLYVHYIRLFVRDLGDLKGGFIFIIALSTTYSRATTMTGVRNLLTNSQMSTSIYVACSGYVKTTNGNDIPVIGMTFGGSSGSAAWMSIQVHYVNSSNDYGTYDFSNDGSWDNQFSVSDTIVTLYLS